MSKYTGIEKVSINFKVPVMVFKIHKPFGGKNGRYVGLYTRYVQKAAIKGLPLEIRIPAGIGLMDAKEWMKTAKMGYTEQLIPGKPMPEYMNTVRIDIPDGEYIKDEIDEYKSPFVKKENIKIEQKINPIVETDAESKEVDEKQLKLF